MPKFLDAPSWYNWQGEETQGYGYKPIFFESMSSSARMDQLEDGDYCFTLGGSYSGPVSIIMFFGDTHITANVTLDSNILKNKFVTFSVRHVQAGTWEYHFNNLSLNSHTSGTSSYSFSFATGVELYFQYYTNSDELESFYERQHYTINGGKKDPLNPNSLYAPTYGGTTGAVLISGGEGSPSWCPLMINNSNAPSMMNSNFFAPTSGGYAGQVLQSNGVNSAPTWANRADWDNIPITGASQYKTISCFSGTLDWAYCNFYIHYVRVSTFGGNEGASFYLSLLTSTSSEFDNNGFFSALPRNINISVTGTYNSRSIGDKRGLIYSLSVTGSSASTATFTVSYLDPTTLAPQTFTGSFTNFQVNDTVYSRSPVFVQG